MEFHNSSLSSQLQIDITSDTLIWSIKPYACLETSKQEYVSARQLKYHVSLYCNLKQGSIQQKSTEHVAREKTSYFRIRISLFQQQGGFGFISLQYLNLNEQNKTLEKNIKQREVRVKKNPNFRIRVSVSYNWNINQSLKLNYKTKHLKKNISNREMSV